MAESPPPADGEPATTRLRQRARLLPGALLLVAWVTWWFYSIVALGGQVEEQWLGFCKTVAALLSLLLAVYIATWVTRLILPSAKMKQADHDLWNTQERVLNNLKHTSSFPRSSLKCMARCVHGSIFAAGFKEEIEQLLKTAKAMSDIDYAQRGQIVRWQGLARTLGRFATMAHMAEQNLYGKTVGDLISKNKCSVPAGSLSNLHADVRRILWRMVFLAVRPKFLWFGLFIIFFAVLESAVAWSLGSSDWSWLWFVSSLALIVPAALLVLYPGQLLVRAMTETTESDIDDLVVSFTVLPAVAVMTLALLALAQHYLPSDINNAASYIRQLEFVDTYAEFNLGPQLFVILVAVWTAVFAWRHVVVRLLRRLAHATQQKQDDVFVEMIYWIGNFVLAALALAMATAAIIHYVNPEISLNDLMYPFAILFSAGAFVIGYSTRETIENFFAGVLLQIDKPFITGERLVLSTGEICDVRSFGMRSATLYNVLENTEMSVPNKVLANMIITNISRPDKQLRIRIDAYVAQGVIEKAASSGPAADGELTTIEQGEAALVHVAYWDDEVTHAKVDESDGTDESALASLRGLLGDLAKRHTSLVEDHINDRLLAKEGPLNDFRDRQSAIIEKKNKNKEPSLQEYKELINSFGIASREVYELKEKHIDLYADMDDLLNALAHEPVVFSSFEVSEDGTPYVRLSLNCFAKHLERRYEVANRLHSSIQRTFKKWDVPYEWLQTVDAPPPKPSSDNSDENGNRGR